jgi:hypothetical protein
LCLPPQSKERQAAAAAAAALAEENRSLRLRLEGQRGAIRELEHVSAAAQVLWCSCAVAAGAGKVR